MTRFQYNFGLSQEDAVSESRVGVVDRSVACIASGGEVPLNLMAMGAGRVVAFDAHAGQISLSRLKRCAALHLDGWQAAAFLGYRHCSATSRLETYRNLRRFLSPEQQGWWDQQSKILERGVAVQGRYERYISAITRMGRLVFSPKVLNGLFTLDDRKARKHFVETKLVNRRLKLLFWYAFREKFYGTNALPAIALRHNSSALWQVFLTGFKTMCIETNPRENYFLQLYLLGELRFKEGLPLYLTPAGQARLKANDAELDFRLQDVAALADRSETYDAIFLSNVCDWLGEEEFRQLLSTCSNSINRGGYVFWRALYSKLDAATISVDGLSAAVSAAPQEWELQDRYPFYRFHILQSD